jgi:hypothetical protein
MAASLEIFSGWKDIANYLGKGVRTVQRYERDLHLPIHRPAGKPHAAVIATKAELDGWVKASPGLPGSAPKHWPTERANKLGAQFLQIDSEIALTFAGIALNSDDSDKKRKRRTAQIARKAYDTIMRLRKGVELTDAQRNKLDANLHRLESELQSLQQGFVNGKSARSNRRAA